MRHDNFDGFVSVTPPGRAYGLDLRPDLPNSTDKLLGIDLTHTIHSTDVGFYPAAAKGGAGSGGGGGGGGGGTSFAPYTAGDPGAYNITIEFKGTWTLELYNVFVSAAERLCDLIVGDLQDVTVYGGKGGPKLVDDITISAELGNIDGLYGVLGQAGPTSVRTSNSLPATAQMKFDIVDVNAMGIDVFTDVVLHEMAHSLGFGSIWDRLGLVTNGLFTGANAVDEFVAMGGSASGIPVEQEYGAGTAGSHWDEETFRNELMTGFIDEGDNYFTAMSAASFADLGYTINENYFAWSDTGYVYA